MITESLKIGVFDSGLGGLSVYQALRHRFQRAELLYVADSAHAPYGNKTANYILNRSQQIARFLIQEQNVDALVIACNTATAAAANALRSRHSLPVIAMEPGIKPAINATQNGIIAVLATQGTLGSQRFASLRDRVAENVTVIDLPCPGWVELVEHGAHQSAAAKQLVAHTLAPIVQQQADTLVLGCTHFPFLRDAIHAACPYPINLIETSEAVARQVQNRLENHANSDDNTLLINQASSQFWSSGDPAITAAMINKLLNDNVEVNSLPC